RGNMRHRLLADERLGASRVRRVEFINSGEEFLHEEVASASKTLMRRLLLRWRRGRPLCLSRTLVNSATALLTIRPIVRDITRNPGTNRQRVRKRDDLR